MNHAVDPSTDEARALAARMTPVSVCGRLVWHAVVDVADRQSCGMGPCGERWNVPILGGRFWGGEGFEALHGEICAGGADRQTLRHDGIKELDALYEMRTHDGAVITVHNQVLIDESVQPERYARSCVRVTAPDGPHAWLNRRLLVGTLQSLRPDRQAVLVRAYMI
jgi:hypothetical protein